MPQHLYTCKVTNIHTKQSTRAYTRARSHHQALNNFCVRYPYPPYYVSEVRDTETGVVMDEDERGY